MKYTIFLSLLIFSSCKDKFENTKPTIGVVTESVYAYGVIKSENQYTVFSTVSGILKKIDVVVGQTILKNQLLQLKSQLNFEQNKNNVLLQNGSNITK